MAEETIRTMYQQCTTALDGLTRQNVELQAELAQSREQAARSESAGQAHFRTSGEEFGHLADTHALHSKRTCPIRTRDRKCRLEDQDQVPADVDLV